MPEFPRNRAHIVLRGKGKAEGYTTRMQPRGTALPVRDRAKHTATLRAAIDVALAAAQARRSERAIGSAKGFYLDFELAAGSKRAAELLENRIKGVELVALKDGENGGPAHATVFVPDAATELFRQKIEEYGTRDTKPRKPDQQPKPRNQDLVARLQSVAIADVKSVFTDDLDLFPEPGEEIWWELWIRPLYRDSFVAAAEKLEMRLQDQQIAFPEREVCLVHADSLAMARLFVNCDAIAELRRAKDTPSAFVSWSNREQADWARDVADRLVLQDDARVSVCVLDTGVTRGHPMLAPAISPGDIHRYDPTWSDGDRHGHGTNMAGVALYGELLPALSNSGPVIVPHRLEAVKVLPDVELNEPRLYGAITRDAVAAAEIAAPSRRRAICMAVSSDIGTSRGRPSSWSSAVDQLAFGDDSVKRLMLVSAGNIRENLSPSDYPARNEVEPVENPGQAWNAITVGAFTEKTVLSDPSYVGWSPVASAGGLCPVSRTSVVWERQWPIKPEILLEGGNWATDGEQLDCPDDLGILTTHRDPTTRHFDIFRDTSAATALASNLAGRIMSALPERWPETIRGLMIHSAEWTPLMRRQLDAAGSEKQKLDFLRKYGYGVPSFERAALSAANDLTLISEDEIQPFQKEAGRIKTREMKLHSLPWPRQALEDLGEAAVELRVSLSYFVEPNPGERGWLRRYRYPSHAFRFELKRALETENDFRVRINKQAIAEEGSLGQFDTGRDGWILGRIRDRGSIHSDHWRGTAADLAKRSLVAVYPVGGWWKENPARRRYDQKGRYALIVSIRALSSAIDIYTPVANAIATLVDVPIG